MRDFLILHYHATARNDSPLWRYCAEMPIPETLQYKMDHFRHYGRLVTDGTELFQNPSWLAVYVGQFNWPERYDPLVDERGDVDAAQRLASLRRVINEVTNIMPTHKRYVRKYCRAAE